MGSDTKDILKIIHYISNALLMLCSIGLITAFLMSMVHGKQYVDLMGKYTPLYLFATVITLVALMIFTSMLGCYGAANHSIRSLVVHLSLLALLIVLMCASAIVGWMNKEKAFDEVEIGLRVSIKEYTPGMNSHDETKAIDEIQSYLECCGITGLKDWAEFTPTYRTAVNKKYPDSCLGNNEEGDNKKITPFVDGCLVKIERWTEKNLWNIGFVIAGFIIFMLVSMCVVCMLIASINAYNSDQYDIEMKNLVHK